MPHGLVTIVIDDSTDKVITGQHTYDRTGGGTLVVPAGGSFPGTPVAGELFWRTDEAKLYRRNDGDTAWEAVVSAVAAHAATHTNGTDDVQTATAGQKGLMSAAAMSKLDGIEAGADVTDADNVATAGAVMKSVVQAKGDLLVGTAAATVTRLAVGTNAHVLTADSSQASGVKWAAGGSATDEQVKVSNDDTTAGYVEDKLVGTANKITLTTNNPGGAETRQITTGSDVLDKAVSGQIAGLTAKAQPTDSDYLVLEDAAASNAKKYCTFGTAPFPRGHLHACNVSYLSVTQVQISAGECRDSADAYNIVVSSQITVAITTSGANGLDTGSEAASQPYLVFVCVGSSGVCGLLSASTTPTLPSGYTWGYRRVGSWINNASSNLLQALQIGAGRERRTLFQHSRLDGLVLAMGSATSWTAVDCSDWVPPGAAEIFLEVYHLQSTAERFALVRPYGWSASDGVLSVSATPEAKVFAGVPNVSQQVEYKCDHSSSDVGIVVLGFSEAL